ncbi:MAG: hypothetical protein Q8L47_03110 [bacterium]|nr:hypothetical protein [bacterium]
MDWTIFKIGMMLIVLQAVLAWLDNHLTRAQVLTASGRPNDFSFFEHPIWLIDTALSLLAAYLYLHLQLDVSSAAGIGTAIFTLAVVVGMIEMWRRGGITVGDHCSHGGVVMLAGFYHGIFFYGMLLYFLQIYLGVTTPIASGPLLFWLSIFFTFFLPLGVVKFSPRWHWNAEAIGQTVGLEVLVWGTTYYRYYLNS